MTDEELIARLRSQIGDDVQQVYDHEALFRLSADRIEALTKERDQHWDSFVHWHKQADDLTGQLAAARRDAEIAEEELGLQEEEACMMEDSYLELKKERDALEAKLAKAVEGQKVNALEQILEERGAVFDAMVDAAEDAAGKDVSFNVVVGRALRAAIAEIKGESHE